MKTWIHTFGNRRHGSQNWKAVVELVKKVVVVNERFVGVIESIPENLVIGGEIKNSLFCQLIQ